jgi:sugar O-acyltransferase (sialic acid O-acetyltransferase NeuD family)
MDGRENCKYSKQHIIMKMEPIILVGGGGHCISCIDVIRLENKFEIIGILDTPEKVGSIISGIEIIGTDDDMPSLTGRCKNFLITIGQIKSCEKRIRQAENIKKYGGFLPVIISPRAYVSQSSVIDEGTIIMHNVLINANARIGKGCIINTGALIEHESVIGNFCHISTHAVINGQVSIGDNSFIGSNSVISNNISLPEGIIVAAGACILKNTDKAGIYIGNPAKLSPNS